ncbi:MAG: alpha-amylase family glycosyl hydrolase [Thermoguttaceae bacterium]
MQPHPTDHPGLLRVPGPALNALSVRFAPLADRDHFNPASWAQHPLARSAAFAGWWEIDLDLLGLADGNYEYEFLINGSTPAADPYADEITRFGGYRGLFAVSGGKRVGKTFRWDGDVSPGTSLPGNNEIVIYELPVKWMSSDPGENAPLVELGTLDKVIFEHLDDLAGLGVNCIELLPIEDSPQTLNWGYGTRFFFAPDYDIGSPLDAKFFVKSCHQRGIRVLLDVVMNMFAPKCPLAALAPQWFYQPGSPSRQDWGQDLFQFDSPAYGNYFAAREFLCEMGEFWVAEYHIDGFRIDDFADINNWDFVQEFHDRATVKSQSLFPGKPFLVVAEDSDGRFVTTEDDGSNPGGRKVVDAIWNFGYRNEIRRLVTNSINTAWGEPSRSVRVQHLISKDGVWNDWNHALDPGYADMSAAVDYITSHDVADAPRLMNTILGPMLQAAQLGDGGVQSVRSAVDGADSSSNPALQCMVQAAFQRVLGAFVMLTTSVGTPMFLAGEEFGDVHDTDYIDVNEKQQDPVQWGRAAFRGNAALKANVAQLIRLRTSHPALQRNEVQCFYFHPQFDGNDSPRVFAYCRTGGQPLGVSGQVIVIANMGPQSFANYDIPGWRWAASALTETGGPAAGPAYNPMTGTLTLSLNSFQARVFKT